MMYLVKETDRDDAIKTISEIRQLIKARRIMEASQKLMKLNDIFMNLKKEFENMGELK